MECRSAIEALRCGVPNGDAVRILGCNQEEIEKRFLAMLNSEPNSDRSSSGLLISADFGNGKSHLLKYLEEIALSKKFVVSRFLVGKETPLYEPAKMFAAAMESAVVPDATGRAIQEIAFRLDTKTQSYAEFYRWAHQTESNHLGVMFPATLMLHERLEDHELLEEIVNYWEGQKLVVTKVKQGLRQIGQLSNYTIKTIPARSLALQRFIFIAQLIKAAGYGGWVLLIDELELIGRYSALSRAKSYAEMARWMGKIAGDPLSDILSVMTIADDFAEAVLVEKGDLNDMSRKLAKKDRSELRDMIPSMEEGMRLIRHEAMPLSVPDKSVVEQTYNRIKEIYGSAYQWAPPDIPTPEMITSRRMRSYIRRWINEWDLKRIYPGEEARMEEEIIHTIYTEDANLEILSDREDDSE